MGTIFYLGHSDIFRPVLFIASFSITVAVPSPCCSLCAILCKSQCMRLCYIICSLLLLLPLQHKYSNQPKLEHPHYKYLPETVTSKLMYILIMNTALFEETLWVCVAVKVEILCCCVRIVVATLNSNWCKALLKWFPIQ